MPYEPVKNNTDELVLKHKSHSQSRDETFLF